MNLMKLERQFLEYLEIEKRRSTKTIDNYDRYLRRFFDFAKINKIEDITEKQVRDFRLYLSRQSVTVVAGRTETMKQRTQNYYLIALRAFLKFLHTRGIETFSPKCIELVRVPKCLPSSISLAELKRLMLAPDTKTLEGKRDRAILELLFSTGLLISELCGLSIDDVDLSQDEFLVRGKGDRVRTVFLSDRAKVTLQEYLSARRDMDDALFIRCGRKMNDGGDLRIFPRVVQRMIKKYVTKAGIKHEVTPQAIRHSFATSLLANGADPESVQTLLGHVNISTTREYTRIIDKHSREYCK